MELRNQLPLLAHRNPQVDGSGQTLDFPGLSALKRPHFTSWIAWFACTRPEGALIDEAIYVSDQARQPWG